MEKKLKNMGVRKEYQEMPRQQKMFFAEYENALHQAQKLLVLCKYVVIRAIRFPSGYEYRVYTPNQFPFHRNAYNKDEFIIIKNNKK